MTASLHSVMASLEQCRSDRRELAKQHLKARGFPISAHHQRVQEVDGDNCVITAALSALASRIVAKVPSGSNSEAYRKSGNTARVSMLANILQAGQLSHLKDGVEYYSVFDLADAYKRILTRASPLGSLKAEINHLAKAVEYESDRVEPIDVIALLHMTTAHNQTLVWDLKRHIIDVLECGALMDVDGFARTVGSCMGGSVEDEASARALACLFKSLMAMGFEVRLAAELELSKMTLDDKSVGRRGSLKRLSSAVKAIATPRKRQAPADSEETAAAEVNVAEGCTKEDSAYTKRQARLAGAAARAKIRASKMA